ncbi:MAG: hypothetical protein RR296_12330, partial [Clostridia bacterium]
HRNLLRKISQNVPANSKCGNSVSYDKYCPQFFASHPALHGEYLPSRRKKRRFQKAADTPSLFSLGMPTSRG